MIPLTPFKKFVAKWQDGCGSCQCESANKVVLCRGSIPCDVLFIGEAPGASEDILGQPFVGPAGKLLDGIIQEAFGDSELCSICLKGGIRDTLTKTPSGLVCQNGHGEPPTTRLRLAFTNLVGCIPAKDEETGKIGEPDKAQIKQCQPRLVEFIDLAKPRMIVTVGALALKHMPPLDMKRGIAKISSIVHPAAILRAVPAQQGMMRRRAVVVLATALEETFKE